MKLSIRGHSFSTYAKSTEKVVKNEVTWLTFQPPKNLPEKNFLYIICYQA